MQDAESFQLGKLTVKELRRQAALRNVPLTHISAAVEKQDLVNLILRARPVTDHYDICSSVKVHSAASIAEAQRSGVKQPKEKKVKKKKKRRRSTSSSNSSSGNRKKRKRSRSLKAIKGRTKKSRSPSVTMIIPTITIGQKEKLVLEIVDTSTVSIPSAINTPVAKASPADIARAKIAAATPKPDDPTLAQRGMAAASALGYDVLPKAPSTSLKAAPGIGLRPSINSAHVGAGMGHVMNIQGLTNSRICTNYLTRSRCDMGANCPEAHITDPEEEMRVRAKFKTQECNKGASCQRRECLYRHPNEIAEETAALVPAGRGFTLRTKNNHLTMEMV